MPDNSDGQTSSVQGGNNQLLADCTVELELTAFKNGKSCLSAGDVGKAFACFLLALKVNPDKEEIVLPLASSLLQWSNKLLGRGRIDDALACCKTSIAALPESAHLWYAYGVCLSQMDMKMDALSAFYKALQLQPTRMPCARWAADILLHELMERWHFPMINDVARNALYAAAIDEGVQHAGKDADALDIGSGTGLLSMYAMRAGLKRIHAVEMAPLMHSVCEQALAGNGLSESVSLRCMSSNELSVPEHMDRRASIVVSEIMDGSVIGEHMVPAMRYAWKHLLRRPSADAALHSENGESAPSAPATVCIPSSASLYAAMVECATLRLSSRVVSDTVMGLDFSQILIVGSDHTEAQPEKAETIANASSQASLSDIRKPEPFIVRAFQRMRGGACPLQDPQRYSSSEALLFHVNFCDPEVPVTLSGECVDFVADTCGYLDVITTFWVSTLYGKNIVSISPFHQNKAHPAWAHVLFNISPEVFRSARCWEKRLQGLCPSCSAVDHPANSARVCKGDTIKLSVAIEANDTVLVLGIEDILRGRASELSHSSKQDDPATANPPPCVFLERSHVARLNDSVYNEVLQSAMFALMAKLPESTHVLDMSYGVPVAGLWALTQGGYSGMSLTVLDGDDNKRKIVDHLAGDHKQAVQHSSSLRSGVYDIIFADLISPYGLLIRDALISLSIARESLSSRGLVCPQRLQLFAMCVDSAGLRAETSVLGSRPTLGVDVARYINKHQLGTNTGPGLDTLRWERLTDDVHMMDLSLDVSSQVQYDLSCQTSQKEVRTVAAGTMCAVLYWFRVHLVDDITFENHPDNCRSAESHWRHAVVMLPEDVSVASGDTIRLDACFQSGCVGFSMTHVLS